MTGPVPALHQGQPCGVFAWRPPVQLVTELSDLFCGPAPAATTGGAGPGQP